MTIKSKKLCNCGYPSEPHQATNGCFRRLYGRKKAAPTKKSSERQKVAISENKAYYARAIAANIIKNKGVCRCDECGMEIKSPSGRSVCHIISAALNKALYHEPENYVILGRGPLFNECKCGWKFDESGRADEMKIW